MAEKLMAAFLALLESAFMGFDKSVSDAITALTTGLVGAEGADILSLMINKSRVLVPFSNVILAAFWAMEMFQVAQKVDTIKWEHVLKLGVKYSFCVSAVNIVPSFLKSCYWQAGSWMNSLKDSDMDMGAKALEELKKSGVLDEVDSIWSAIGLLMVALVVLLAIKICGLLIQVVAYGRLFELCVYIVASPLPVAFFPLGNGNGDGFNRITLKFLRAFAAVCFQGVLMIIVLSVFDSLLGTAIYKLIQTAAAGASGGAAGAAVDATTTITEILFQMLLAAVALVMSVTKCNSWARNILDAN